MKRLAILSSLALIVAPTFSGNGVSDLAKNQIRFAEETGGATNYESKEVIIHFGTKVDSNSGTQSGQVGTEDYSIEGSIKGMALTFDYCCYANTKNPEKWTSDTENYPLRINSSNKPASFKISFGDNVTQIVEKVVISAKAIDTKKEDGKITVKTTNRASPSYDGSIVSTDWTDYTISNLDSGTKTATEYLQFTGTKSKSTYVSLIKLYILTPVSTTATVTYDYGGYKDDSWKTSETVTKGEKATPSISEFEKYCAWDGKHTLFAWNDDDGNEFNFETTPINSDITLHAEWYTEDEDKSEELKNVESSETKSQLSYTYDTSVNKKGTFLFGENENTGGSKIDSSSATSYFAFDNGFDETSTLTFDNCFSGGERNGDSTTSEGDNYAVRVLKNGSLTITFDQETHVKEAVVWARGANGDVDAVFQAKSCDNDGNVINSTTNTIAVGSAKVFAEYAYKNIDGDNGEKLSKTLTFNCTNNKRVFISKIELIVAEETSNYYVSNMGLRFGGAIAKDHYEAATQNETGKTVKDHVTSVGMIWTTALPETTDGKTYDSLTAAIEANAITETNAHIKTMDVTEKELVLDGDYYRYNCSISVSEASINTEIYAVATMTFDNGLTIYFEEAKYSVVTIAQKYVEDTTTYDTYSEPIQKTLKALSEGKTSVAIA